MRNPIVVSLLITLVAACGGITARDRDAGQSANDVEPAVGGATPGLGDGGRPGPTLVISGPALLGEALARMNQLIQDRELPVRQLSEADLRTWFDESKDFVWSKRERGILQPLLDAGALGDGWTLKLEQIVVLPDHPWRITLCAPPVLVADSYLTSCGNLAEGLALDLWVASARGVCQDPTHDLCDEPFKGPCASSEPVALSPSVEVRVEPIQVAGQPHVPELAVRDALAVSVNVSAATIRALVDYFAVGYDRVALDSRLRSLLGDTPSRWVEVQDFMFGWIRERANTFPGTDDNDVCHGPARLFYSDVLYNGGYDRSTEAVAVLLTDHYCQVADDAPPRFGDYLYNPGAHSARYILRDPASGRDIVFSVQSGGISAYRFYWADEDMSGKPFDHQPMIDYRQALVDTWRRCR
jgi:hypothetical protein